MPRLPSLPSAEVIKGFRGVVDFAEWRGIAYVKKYPKFDRSKLTAGTLEAASQFADVSRLYSLLDPQLKSEIYAEFGHDPLAARDYFIRATYGRLHIVVHG